MVGLTVPRLSRTCAPWDYLALVRCGSLMATGTVAHLSKPPRAIPVRSGEFTDRPAPPLIGRAGTLGLLVEPPCPAPTPPSTRNPTELRCRALRHVSRRHLGRPSALRSRSRGREFAQQAKRASTGIDPGGDDSDPDPALVDAVADAVVARLRKLLRSGLLASPDHPSQPSLPAGEWLTASEAAQYLGFRTMKAFYSAAERGQVPYSRIGRRLRFNRAGLDRLLDRRAARMDSRVPSPGKESERW